MNMWLRTFFAYLWCWVSFFHGHSWHLCWFRTTDRPCIFNLVWTCNRHILSEINLSSTSSEWPERKDNRGPKSCAFVCCYCWYNTSHHWYKVELHTSFVTTMCDIDDQTIRVTMCEKQELFCQLEEMQCRTLEIYTRVRDNGGNRCLMFSYPEFSSCSTALQCEG